MIFINFFFYLNYKISHAYSNECDLCNHDFMDYFYEHEIPVPRIRCRYNKLYYEYNLFFFIS